MLVPKSASPKKILVLAIILVIILGIIGYLLLGKKINISLPLMTNRSFNLTIPLTPRVRPELETNLLNSNKFKKLEVFGPATIEIQSLGRDNPFQPY